jgi:hypothetical protein
MRTGDARRGMEAFLSRTTAEYEGD